MILPLVSMMKDQVDFLASRGVTARRLDCEVSSEGVHSINEEILSGEVKILYVSPERYALVRNSLYMCILDIECSSGYVTRHSCIC